MHRVIDELVNRTNAWLDANSTGRSEFDVMEAVAATLTSASTEELGAALQDVLSAARTEDVDARDVVAAFNRVHPPQSLSNPERQRSLVGNYLILRLQGIWA